MCGIAGLVRVVRGGQPPPMARALPDEWIAAMDGRVAHRGPDGAGVLRHASRMDDGRTVYAALIHRRLAIIDPVGGEQPMTDVPAPRAPTLAVVFNGCIYNHRALRAELGGGAGGSAGFRSDHSDTEVVLRGYAAWGKAMVPRLEGMFALAVYDAASGGVLVARDHAGEKPLYFARVEPTDGLGEVMAFASTVPALVALMRLAEPGAERELDPAAVGEWAARGFGAALPFARIEELKPGEMLFGPAPGAGDADEWYRQTYWRPPARAVMHVDGEPLTALKIERLLADSVAARLEADVPLGCFLSGGLDSSLVAVFAKRVIRDLRTFTLRMPDPNYDESRFAEMVARRLFCKHTTLDCRPDAAGDLVRLIDELGLPLGDSSLLPTYWVSRAAREAGLKVALSGDGGDELFAGYDRYRAAGLLSKWGGALALIPPMDAMGVRAPMMGDPRDPKSRGARASRLGRAARGGGYPELVSIFQSQELARLGLRVNSTPCAAPMREAVSDAPAWDFGRYLPGDLLRKVDTASMSVGLEVRCPMLATAVVEECLAAPLTTLMPGGSPKALLRHVARKFLPAQVADRPKAGFAVPLGAWLRQQNHPLRTLMIDALTSDDPFNGSGIAADAAAIQRLIDEHTRGRRDHAQRLYALTAMSVWTRGVMGA